MPSGYHQRRPPCSPPELRGAGGRGEGAAAPARWVLLPEDLGAMAKVAINSPCTPEPTPAEPGAQTRSHSHFLAGYRKAVRVCSATRSPVGQASAALEPVLLPALVKVTTPCRSPPRVSTVTSQHQNRSHRQLTSILGKAADP